MIHATLRRKKPHKAQRAFMSSPAKHKLVRAGRRGGKTKGLADEAAEGASNGEEVMYAAPTSKQTLAFWRELMEIYAPLEARGLAKSRTNPTRVLELPTGGMVTAQTAWNVDSFRGGRCHRLILDEYQLMDELIWEASAQPCLMDFDGSVTFLYTPASIYDSDVSKAKDKHHAAKLWDDHQDDPDWDFFTFTTWDNPYIPRTAIQRRKNNMTEVHYLTEIMAQDVTEDPNALWTRRMIKYAYGVKPEDMERIVIGVDPSGSMRNEVGIIVVGILGDKFFVLFDGTMGAPSPDAWAEQIADLHDDYEASLVVAEINFGGAMVESTIHKGNDDMFVKVIHASRSKQARAEPITRLYQRGQVYHCDQFVDLEDQMCQWVPGQRKSPDRLDALVWAMTELADVDMVSLDMWTP